MDAMKCFEVTGREVLTPVFTGTGQEPAKRTHGVQGNTQSRPSPAINTSSKLHLAQGARPALQPTAHQALPFWWVISGGWAVSVALRS